MNLIALGFWISLGLAILEVLKVISIGWLLVATPFLLGIGISLALVIMGLIVMFIAFMLSK